MNVHAFATAQSGAQPATTGTSPWWAVTCRECGYPVRADLAACEYCEIPKLTGVLPKLGVLTAMLLFSVSFYYGFVRLAMWLVSR
jgi:hypothetical protein